MTVDEAQQRLTSAQPDRGFQPRATGDGPYPGTARYGGHCRQGQGGYRYPCDGGVRYGADVLKMLALELMRCWWAVRWCGVRGLAALKVSALMLKKMQGELVVAMTLTGTADVKKVSRTILV